MNKKKRLNIRIILFLNLILLIFVLSLFFHNYAGGFSKGLIMITDFPSILGIIVITVPCMLIMGIWHDFISSFSIGIKQYTLLQLKNINEAVVTCQKLILYSGLIEFIISIIVILFSLESPDNLAAFLAVATLSAFYTVVFEYLVLPLKVNATLALNQAMDVDEEWSSGIKITL